MLTIKTLFSTTVLAACSTGWAFAIEDVSMPSGHRKVLENRCIRCHDSETSDGGVDLENLSFQIETTSTAEVWQKVLNVLNAGEMPPEGEPQIEGGQKQRLLRDLSTAMVNARHRLSDSGGKATMRRLNRREYENTIKDLLGIDINAEGLPRDQNSDGFDTNGSALFFSSDQFEQYLATARDALDEALLLGAHPPKTISKTIEPETSVNASHRRASKKIKGNYDKAKEWRDSDGSKPPSEFGLLDEFDVRFRERLHRQQYATYRRYLDDPRSKEVVLLQEFFNQTNSVKVEVPKKQSHGEYRLDLFAKVLPGAKRSETYLEYGFPGARGGEIKRLGYVRVPKNRSQNEPITLQIPITKTGPREIVIRHRQHNNLDASRSSFLTSQKKTGFGPEPKLAIDRIVLTGPHFKEWPLPAVDEIYFKGNWWQQPDQNAYAKEIIERFAARAFRTRSPSAAFIDRLHRLFMDEFEKGTKFQIAIREPLAIVLSSPGFLYLAEPKMLTVGTENSHRDPEPIIGSVESITDAELAVRLSYLLWSAPPDDILRAAVETGTIREEGTLRQQANRMLDDVRSREFFAAFTHQWLEMERLDFFQYDHRLFPEFDDSVKESARLEVFETVRHVICESRPPKDLLEPGYVVVNDLLADYYDIPKINGTHFQKVSVPKDSPRGGLLGMAAIHAMGSDGTHASLVERGAWVLRHLLNDPPPPAPPNVPQLSRVRGKLLSPRDQMSAHMEQPQCASCHRQIDPIGYGLENFDAAGQWRNTMTLRQQKGKKEIATKKISIDPSGSLPNGEAFTGFRGLRTEVAKYKDAFSRGFAEALIEYALGRPYSFSDDALREQVMVQANSKDGSMREMILALIESTAFERKKN